MNKIYLYKYLNIYYKDVNISKKKPKKSKF